MPVGAGIFAELYPNLKGNLLKWRDFGKLSIPKVIGVNHCIIILMTGVVLILALPAVGKKRL